MSTNNGGNIDIINTAGSERRREMAREYYNRRLNDCKRIADKRDRYFEGKDASRKQRSDRRYKRTVGEYEIRLKNRLKKLEDDEEFKSHVIRHRIILFAVVSLVFLVIALEFLLPDTQLRKSDILSEEVVDDIIEVEIIKDKPYDKIEGMTDEQYLWNALMDHFDGNKTAVLGVMCNLNAESEVDPGNLEDYNNKLWDIEDAEYTEKVNNRVIDKKDFLESRSGSVTNGYYNKHEQWVNRDGGYGYAQFTAYEKKEKLYQFAEQWFGPGGQGEQYKFNIADPKMQTGYLISLLESKEYASMDHMIRTAGNVVDACYYWLKTYEVPYDPYCDGYYTLSFDRAAAAEKIEKECTSGTDTENEQNGE